MNDTSSLNFINSFRLGMRDGIVELFGLNTATDKESCPICTKQFV